MTWDEDKDQGRDSGVKLHTREQGQRYGSLLEAMTDRVDLSNGYRGRDLPSFAACDVVEWSV